MIRRFVTAPAVLLLAACSQVPVRTATPAPPDPYPDAAIETSLGTFVVQLDRARAPLTPVAILKAVLLPKSLD